MKLLPLASLLALTTGVTAHEYVCETTDASPYLHHVEQLIDNLQSSENINDPFCLDYSLGSSECGPTIRKYSGKDGGAAWQLCKGDNRDNDPLRCYFDPGGMPCVACRAAIVAGEVGIRIRELKDRCQGEDSNGDIRVGGIIKLGTSVNPDGNDNGEVRLYSMPG